MDEDENRDQVSQGSMEDSMSTMQEGAGKAADATKSAAKFMGEKLKSSKMAQRVQKAKEKAAAKAKAVAKETARGTKKVIRGATTLGAGAALSGAGAATQAAGAAMSAAGQAITASTLGIGAAIGETMDAIGQGMQQAGKGMVKSGKKIMKHGTKTMKKGAEQIAKAPLAKPGKTSSGEGDVGGVPKPKIPFIGRKKKKKSTKEKAKRLIELAIQHPVITGIIIGAIILLILIIFIVLAVSSSVNRGKYNDGDYSNVPYVVTSMALDKLQIYPDGQGGFTYGFEDENGNAMTLDEALDKILETLKENDSSAYSDMCENDDERKDFLKLLIQAEIATQYPDLSIKGDGNATSYMTASGMTSTASGKDYCVATDQPNAATVLNEEQLRAAVNNSNMGDQAKQNVLGVIPDLVRLQEQYKVNALFLIAAARTESGCGTGWDLIDPSTYNWLSVKGTENGGYIDRNGTSWNRFSSYAEATESWFKLITGSSHYFKAGKYTVKSIAPTYCDSAWGETVSKYMDEFYGYAGASGQREVAAVTNASYSSSPSQSQVNLAQWGWLIQNENINAYYYEHGYGTITYNSYAVKGYITQDGKDYIVVDNGAGLYVGSGVQLVGPNGARNTFNLDLLANHGVDITNISAGRTMNADAVDKVSQEIFLYKKNEIQSQAAQKGLSLTDNQIVALIDISYLNGNCTTQLNNIARYGANSDQLANTSGFAPCGENDTPVTRAQCVWKLYRYGKYEARQQSVYDPTYFGGVPSSTEGGNTSHSGTAHAGGIDANGVTITDHGNIDFLNYAIDCHKLLREDGFYYWNGGREMPVVKGDPQHTIDCVAYVSMALDCYGRKDWRYYPHQLTVDECISYGKDKLETVYEGNASSINEISDLQSGDIVIMPGHGQIFYGYASNGDPVWLNCGGNSSIQQVEGQGGWYATPILYVFRVPGGSGNAYTQRASQILTGNEDSVQGKIKIKRKDSSGNEVNLGYIDEATFDSMISSNNPDVMNYYTLKKGSNGNTSSGSTGNVTLSGSETKEQIWNFLIDSGFTEQGAAALMGNLEAESGCKPVRVQGDYNHGNADEYSQNYTNQVDNGQITKDQFVHNGPGGGGYGLAQWTDPGRKEKLYDYAKSKGTSIGDLQTQLEYLVQELSTNAYYSTIWSMVTTSTDMNATCDLILKRFENPADIAGNTPIRRNNAASIYSTYSGTKTAGNNNNTSNSTNTNNNNTNTNNTNSNTATGLVNDTYTFKNGGSMSYYLYVPSDTNSAKPLVVYQHGRSTRDPTWGDHGWAYLAKQKGENFDYYALEPISSNDNWDPAKLKELTEHIISKYNIDTSKISLWGFSNGAEYLDANVVNYPDFYSSVVILARGAIGMNNASSYVGKKVFIEYGGNDTAYNHISAGQTAKNCNAIYQALQGAGVDVKIKNQGDSYGHGETLTRAIHDQEVTDFIFNGVSSSSSTVSFDNFLFLGDSRYVGVKSELEALGNNVSVCAVSSSTPKQWDDIIDNGSGTVISTSITLPNNASGVSVMLGANAGASQINELKEVMQKLHNRYPNAKIYFNSVYHLGSNYTYANVDDTNAGYDRVNEEMKSFCNSNSWAEYVDITEGIHDENGYLKYPDGEGIHLTGEGRTILVENIKNKIKGAGSNNSNSSSSNTTNPENAPDDRYSIAVASYDQKTVTSTDSYQYAYTKVISTNSGTTGYGSQFSSTPAGYSTTNVTYTYKTSYADYQPAVKNHTFYFDFLWAVYIASGDKELVEEMAQEAIDSTLEITIYSDTKVTQNVSTSTIQPKVIYKREGSTAYEDHYNGTNTTTTTNTIVTSKGCLTLANVWNMEYENNAGSYSEFKAKSKEKVREKIEDDDKIMVILRKKSRADVLDREYYMLEDMLEENTKVEHMIDIFKYYVEIATKSSKSKAKNTTGNYIDTGLFDLSNSQSSSTVKVLLYTSLNISDADKEMMYKAIEQMTSAFPDDDENKQRKKYIASVILNRALSSSFPDSVRDVISQTGQFPNLNTSDLSNVTYSDSTKIAVDSVIQGGDCSKYSVYFNTPSGASSLDWDNKYTKTLNDGDETDNSYSYYTSDEITNELKSFEVSVAAGTTMPSEAANQIVRWAEAQVGKSTYRNKNSGKNEDSKNSCAAFVKCAYNEAGLGYMSGNAKDLPHPNTIQFNSDGSINYSKIPVGAIIVSKGVPVDGVEYGHVCLYVGNGYVIEAGGDKIQKTPIEDSFGGKGHNCAPFIGWGFAMEDQDAAYEQLVIRLGGGASYPEGWTPNDDATRQATGIEGYYVVNGRQYNVYAQGFNDVWGHTAYSMGTYSSSACGATSAAIIASGLNPEITPIETGHSAYSYAGSAFGSRTTAVTECAALTRALSDAGLRGEWKGCTKQDIINHLQSGQPVILLLHSQRAGNNTYGGHYVTLLGMNGQGQIFLGDPAGGGSNTGYFDQSMFSLPADGVCFVYFD